MIHANTSRPDQQWTVHPHGTFQRCGATVLELPPAAYTCQQDCYGNIHFHPHPLNCDDYIDFPDSLPSRILRELNHFWALGDRFREMGFLHRRGYLFYGKQGGGKSSLIHQIVRHILDAGHVAFFCQGHPALLIEGLRQFRSVEPERPIVCIFEDIDAIIKEHGDSDLLQCLDGNHQVDLAVNLASTNYPEKLDRRIVSRPRRFDRIHRIDAPDARYRDAYFARKMTDQPAEERQRWVELSAGLQFAALAELVISVQCLGNDLEETAALLRTLDQHNPSSHEFNGEAAAV